MAATFSDPPLLKHLQYIFVRQGLYLVYLCFQLRNQYVTSITHSIYNVIDK